MAHERLLDRENPPDRDLIYRTIGEEVFPIWQHLETYLDEKFSEYQSELIYYNPQHGWGIRYRNDLSQLCTLFPEGGSFTVLLTLDPEEEAAASDMLNYFNARIRELLSRSAGISEGRFLWIPIEDHTDFVGLKLLLEIKET